MLVFELGQINNECTIIGLVGQKVKMEHIILMKTIRHGFCFWAACLILDGICIVKAGQ
jgi:hypothetical protein